jgi:hypothetical protein
MEILTIVLIAIAFWSVISLITFGIVIFIAIKLMDYFFKQKQQRLSCKSLS